jgi:hypothetical protein
MPLSEQHVPIGVFRSAIPMPSTPVSTNSISSPDRACRTRPGRIVCRCLRGNRGADSRARHSAVASAPAWSPGWREASAASGTERLRAPGRHPPRSYTTCTVNVNSLGTCEATGEPLGVFPGSGLEQPWTVAGGQAKVLITTTCARPGARAVNVKSPRGCSAGAENSPRGIPVRIQCRSDDEPRFSLK